MDGTDPRIDRALDDALTAAGFRLIRLDERFKAEWDKAQSNGSTIAMADGWLSNRRYVGNLRVSLITQAAIQLGELQYITAYKGALSARRSGGDASAAPSEMSISLRCPP